MVMVNVLTSYNSVDQQLYVVRNKRTGHLMTGYRGGNGPKLYMLGGARRVITMKRRHYDRYVSYGSPSPAVKPFPEYEILPVKVLLESPVE